ncbi:MAG: 4-hydroxy-tetrahydrodipicolinate reductase [Salibacteraceae bacterium]
MKIAIIGYGKMGKEIEAIAIERGHEICAKLTSSDKGFGKNELNDADAAIEFTRPEFAVENIKACFNASVPVIVGTTGWYDDFEQIKQDCQTKKGAILSATNFSLGVNIFWKANEYLASIMNTQPSYNVSMEEIHHTQKLDAPSGTAITTAEKIINQVDRKTSWSLDTENSPEELKIEAKRLPDVPGTHEVFYSNEIDTISMKHEANSRKGFALGSVLAAEFIKDKQGVFTMNDLLKF